MIRMDGTHPGFKSSTETSKNPATLRKQNQCQQPEQKLGLGYFLQCDAVAFFSRQCATEGVFAGEAQRQASTSNPPVIQLHPGMPVKDVR